MIDHLEQTIGHHFNGTLWLIEALLLPGSVPSSAQAPNTALGHKRVAALRIAFISLRSGAMVRLWKRYGSRIGSRL